MTNESRRTPIITLQDLITNRDSHYFYHVMREIEDFIEGMDSYYGPELSLEDTCTLRELTFELSALASMATHAYEGALVRISCDPYKCNDKDLDTFAYARPAVQVGLPEDFTDPYKVCYKLKPASSIKSAFSTIKNYLHILWKKPAEQITVTELVTEEEIFKHATHILDIYKDNLKTARERVVELIDERKNQHQQDPQSQTEKANDHEQTL